ncbi:ATP-binding protein [Streptomyces prasinus]|uniref:ATP-binding protein n=1 Tax=Streptomyces prasinus TaxID=67345 RepID=UPI000A49EC97|nr:ATP-binding protein [Streptomyces prasinus]
MTDTTVPRDLLTGLPSRRTIAELILSDTPSRDTFAGWQHFRATRGLLVPAQRLSVLQWRTLPPRRRDDYDTYRQMTNVNLPLQQTPMAQKVSRLIDRRLSANTRKKGDPTLAGVMVSGWGQHGKTATVCRGVAAFEDRWLQLHNSVNPASVPGTVDLHSPVAYVQTPVTATPKSTCVTILNFFQAPSRGLTLPQLVRQVAESLRDHGVEVLIIDDINRLRMHRADDQDVLDLIRAFMGLDVTLILTGVNIPGTDLLREARWHSKQRSWVMPPLESTRVHGLEVTQTERRFELVELDRFRTTSPAGIQAFANHLQGHRGTPAAAERTHWDAPEGTMPEYLMRRTNGVVGLLGRLIEDGCLEAMASGKELLDEVLLDEIVIGRDDLTHPPDSEDSKVAAPPAKPAKRRSRGRNTVFDDHGPRRDRAAG